MTAAMVLLLLAVDVTSDAVAQARALLAQDKPAAAIQRLEGLDGGDPRVALALGVAHYHSGNALGAIERLRPLVAKLEAGSVERREAVQVLGLSHYLAGRIADSIPFLEETRQWAPDNLELLHILGNAYIQVQKPNEARAAFARNFGVLPDSAAAHLLAAQMMLRAQQENQAEGELQLALAKDATLPQVSLLLGQIALFRGRLPEAVERTRQELALSPGNAMAWSQLGDAYLRQQAWDEAIAALQRSVWINPFYSAPYILLGRAYTKKGQPATAEGMLRRAVEYDPNNRTAHYLLGQLLQQMGRADEAQKELDIAARLQGPAAR